MRIAKKNNILILGKYFVQGINGTEIHKFKVKDSEIVASPLCLGNISEDFPVLK